MLNNHARHILEVKTLVDTLPTGKRIELYRWLADLAGDAWTTEQLLRAADELETADRHSQLFAAELNLKLAGGMKSHPSHDGHHKHKGDGK